MKYKICIFSLVALIILAAVAAVIIKSGDKEPETEFVTVSAPVQDAPFIPEWAVPAKTIERYLGDNLAMGKELICNNFTDVYAAKNANDGDSKTYWEGASDKYPNDLALDLGQAVTIGSVRIRLNPETLWGKRKQTFSIQGSTDGQNYTDIVYSKDYEFDPVTGNVVIVNFVPVEVRFIRLDFTANTGAKAGQVAEFEVYAPNLAFRKDIVCNNFVDVYIPKNANDGNERSYWEGAQDKYPNQLTIDLAKPTSIKCITIRLNPNSMWEARKQTFAILGSSDGQNFTPIVDSKEYEFDPKTGNLTIMNFDAVETRFIRLEFSANTAAKAGQVAEFEVY